MALLETTTAEGALKGMILGRAPHELGDQEAAYLQDILVNNPGFLDRRGAITNALPIGNVMSSRRPVGVVSCYAPDGSFRIMVLYTKFNTNNSTAYDLCGAVFDSTFAYLGSLVVASPSFSFASAQAPWQNPGIVITSTPSIDGGVTIGYATGYKSTDMQFIAQWWGGYSPNFTDAIPTFGTVAITTTVETSVVTASAADVAKLKSGVLIANVGIVKTIDSATQFTLVAPTELGTASYSVFATQGVVPIRTRGRISVASGGTQVTGYGTRFKEHLGQGIGPGTNPLWVLRNMDDSLIAHSTTGAPAPDILSDTALQTTGVASAVSKSLAPFYMYTISPSGRFPNAHPTGDYGFVALTVGAIPFTYRGYQFYSLGCDGVVSQHIANTASLGNKASGRTWIAGPHRYNEFDHSTDDGNFFDLSPTAGDISIYAGLGGTNAAVICKAHESYGIIGSSPDDFESIKILSDGALVPTAITKWQNNVIWLGRDGIWMWDGIPAHAPVNLVRDSMGVTWQQRLDAFRTESTALDADNQPLNQAHCFVYKDHLFVNITNTGNTHVVYTDGVARTSNTMQLMIYLPNNALSFITNFNFQGYLPGFGQGAQQEGYTLLSQSGSTSHYFFPMSNFFKQSQATVDAILTSNSYNSGTLSTSVGPWYHLESRKIDIGDGLRRKTWKQLSTESLLTSTKRMFMETVPGLNTTGTRVVTPYVGIGLWKALKLRFNSRDQYMSFRLYEDINNRPDNLRLGAWQWGYKLARRGQV